MEILLGNSSQPSDALLNPGPGPKVSRGNNGEECNEFSICCKHFLHYPKLFLATRSCRNKVARSKAATKLKNNHKNVKKNIEILLLRHHLKNIIVRFGHKFNSQMQTANEQKIVSTKEMRGKTVKIEMKITHCGIGSISI